MSDGPFPILILPDGVLLGRDNVASVTSEAGPTVAPAVPGADNYGDLLPVVTALSLSEDYAHDIRVQRAGGVYALAEWVHKQQVESTYVGVDEVTHLSDPHDPFLSPGMVGSHPVSAITSITACVCAQRIGKIFLFVIGSGTSTVYIRSRAIGAADPNTWALSTVNLSGKIKALQQGGIDVIELPDGTLRMFVIDGTAATTDNDVNVFASQDGDTWTLTARGVISKAYGTGINILRMRVAVSGDWIRLVLVDATAPTLRTFVSSDRGATMTYLSEADLTGADGPEVNGLTVDPYGHVDICGVGDASGSFVLGFRRSTNSVLDVHTAGRDSAWSLTNTVTTTGDIFSAKIVNDGMRIYFLCATKIAGAAGAIRIEGAFTAVSESLTMGFTYYFAPWGATALYMPAYMSGCKADPGYLLFWGLVNPDTGAAVGSSTGLVYGRQWTTRSLWKNEQEEASLGGTLHSDFMTLRWDSLMGVPNRTSSVTTPIVHWFGASGTATWLTDRTRLDSAVAGAAGLAMYAYVGSGTRWLTDSAYAGWICGLISGPASVTHDSVAVRLRARTNPAGTTFDLSFRHSTTQIVVYDNNASVALATLAATLDTQFYTCRVGFGSGGAATTRMEFAIAGVSNVAGPASWSSATVTPTSAVGATFQGYEWGHLSGVAGVSSYWRRMEHDDGGGLSGVEGLAQYGFTNPDSMRGAPCASKPIYLDDGLYVSWTGGSGFEGDTFTIDQRNTYEVENLFLPSPQAPWIGTSLTTQTLVFCASSTDASVLLDHGGVAVFGTVTHRLTVEYNDTNSWGTPAYSAAVTNDITPALRVTASTNHAVDVEGVTLDDGAYVGKYARNVLSGLNVTSLRISRQVGNRLYLDAAGTANATRAFSAGSSLWIHDDKFIVHHATRQKYPFMRLTFPAPSGTTTATLDIRAGTLVAGPTMDFPTEMAWAHNQTEEGNVELSDGTNGLRWGYQLGQSRRALEGTIRGDVYRNRQKLAAQIRTLAQFSARVLAFSWDRLDPQRSGMLARFAGDFEHQNVGWRQETDGTWYPVGDLTVTFEEDV